MPLVSLEQAVFPLVPSVADVEQMVWIVTSNCSDPKEGLTSDEAAAIMMLSMDWYPQENSFGCLLNAALATANTQTLKPWFSYLRLLFQALSKLPNVEKVVYQGEKKKSSQYYTKGKKIASWEISICSLRTEALQNASTFGTEGDRTLLTIECHSGKDISQHAFEQDKEQVLLLPGRQLEVTACLDAGDGLHIIQLKENAPLHSFT